MNSKQCKFCQNNARITEIKLNIPVCVTCLDVALSQYEELFLKSQKDNPEKLLELKNYKIGFGKFKGRNILDTDANYLKWCLENFEGLRDVDIFKSSYETLSGTKFTSKIAAIQISNHSEITTNISIEKKKQAEPDNFPF